MKCRGCKTNDAQTFLKLGESPLANSFVKKEDAHIPCETFPLELAYCTSCHLVQLTHVVNPSKLFSHYVYVSSTTKTFHKHFKEMADKLTQKCNLTRESTAVDIGSNDGLLLKFFKENGVQIIGVEPAENLAKVANENGLTTINAFFGNESANTILQNNGKVDVVTANNVFAHIEDIHDVTENVKKILKPNGVFVIEFQYLFRTIEDMTFDNVYHEHLYYYSLTSIKNFFKIHNMEIFDVEEVDTHGGSLRIYVQNQGAANPISSNVTNLLDQENEKGVTELKTYEKFAQRVQNVKTSLNNYIKDLKQKGKVVVGYGAPAKSTTLMAFAQLSKNQIDYVVEDNPLKQGLLTPGTHIPVESREKLQTNKPDAIVIFAWNFAPEIMEKISYLKQDGVEFFVPLPTPKQL